MENNLELLINDLEALDNQWVRVDGMVMKPSQCYRFETDPVHLMFNTNCPDELKQKVQSLLDKYLPQHESGTPQ